MNRRKFIQKVAVGAAGTGVLSACAKSEKGDEGPNISTKKQVRWFLASSFTRNLDTIFGAAEVLSARVEALTEGRFTIRVRQAGDLVGGLAVLDAVQQGSAQCGHTAGYYYKGKHPALALDTTVPFGLTSRQQSAWLLHGGGLDAMRKVYGQFDVINFPGGNTGVQMGGWFRREVPGLNDLKGLKMRIPGFGGEVMSALGVSAQVQPAGDIYPALERGNIDAAEWVGPYDDMKLGFHEVAKHYYYPGWWEPGPCLTFLVNRKAWEELPALYQEAFTVAAAEAHQDMTAKYDVKNPAAFAELKTKGIQLHRFSDEIMQAAAKVTHEMLEAQAASNPDFGAIYGPWKAFRESSRTWFSTAEFSYDQFTLGT